MSALPSHNKGSAAEESSSPAHQRHLNHGFPSGPVSRPRKSQMVSGNHLLNFHYASNSVSRPRSAATPPRRLAAPRRKPYNKDLFLQANYKFVMLDSGKQPMDPDKMLQWEDIICLKYYSPVQVLCPICLEPPLCPQITPCGHIYCFPCVLQFLMLGEDDHRAEYTKECPLCFMMLSSKDMFSIFIQNVQEYRVGDAIHFWLLTRQKESFVLSLKNNDPTCPVDQVQDSFSKFTFTSDINLSVREAMADLHSWLARADSGLVDDLEKLPYVCAALQLLEQRKKYWEERQQSNSLCSLPPISGPPHPAEASDVDVVSRKFASSRIDRSAACLQNSATGWIGETSGAPESLDCHNGIFPSSIEDNNVKLETKVRSWDHGKTKNSYNFYQAVDGQNLILHPLSMKCLLHHYGTHDRLPNRISGKILQLESVRQSEEVRKRYRYLSHFSLTATFQFCEIDLTEMLPADALSPFMDEISNREKQRKRLARKEHSEKIKAEATGSHLVPVTSYLEQSSYGESPTTFSMDEFQALGSSASASSSPPDIGERHSFSTVARLGYAAGHDSPVLKMEEADPQPRMDSFNLSGRSSSSGPSFASIASRGKAPENPEAVEVVGKMAKKGKKPSRVLMSTAGGRRY